MCGRGSWRRFPAALLALLPLLHCAHAVQLCGEQVPRPLLAGAARRVGGGGPLAPLNNPPLVQAGCSLGPLVVRVVDDTLDAWCEDEGQPIASRNVDAGSAWVPVALTPVLPVAHVPAGGRGGATPQGTLPPTSASSAAGRLALTPAVARALFLDPAHAYWDAPALVALNPHLLQGVGHVPIALFGLPVGAGAHSGAASCLWFAPKHSYVFGSHFLFPLSCGRVLLLAWVTLAMPGLLHPDPDCCSRVPALCLWPMWCGPAVCEAA
jgi:hypothetical protein